MAIFGKTKIGGTQNTQSSNFEETYGYWLPEVGAPTSIYAYLTGLAGGPQANRFTLRRTQTVAGVAKPGLFVDASSEVTVPASTAAAWYRFPLLQAGLIDLQPGLYWLGVWTGAVTNTASLAYDAVAGFSWFEAETYSATNPPATTTWTGSGTGTHEASVYCEYIPRVGPFPRGMPQGV